MFKQLPEDIINKIIKIKPEKIQNQSYPVSLLSKIKDFLRIDNISEGNLKYIKERIDI